MHPSAIILDLRDINFVSANPFGRPPDVQPPSVPSDFVLRRVQLVPRNTCDELQVHETTTLHVGRKFKVFRAKLRADKANIDVVLKVSQHSEWRSPNAFDLEKEARLYETKLTTAQGKVVPQCFGFFRGRCSGIWISCLVLQYCGEPRRVPFHEMDLNYRLV
ncbi:hypothetical protein PLICRDRAFT_174751 [Plicaturopsis crispa FD-325 SS-3]|nr:hypothetical protein PLICRDRAFT_174751 [Plicaturopsis crispa FD-325 SS-3]